MTAGVGNYVIVDTETARRPLSEHTGLLTGPAGVRLTLHTLTTGHHVEAGWETCLLLN